MKKRIYSILICSIMLLNIATPSHTTGCDDCEGHFEVVPSNPCSWPMYRHDLCNTASIQVQCAPECIELGLHKNWEFVLPADQEINSPPSLDYGKAFFGTCSGMLYGIDAALGPLAPFWFVPLLGGIYTSPAIWNERVYIGTDAGFMYCYSIFGAFQWVHYVGAPIRCSPKIFEIESNSKYSLVFGDDKGRLWCLNPMNGRPRSDWNNTTTGCFDTYSEKPIRSSPLIEGDNIYFYCKNMRVYSITKLNGAMRWSYNITAISTTLPDDEVVCTAKNVNSDRYIILSTVGGLAYLQDFGGNAALVEMVNTQLGLYPKTNPAINKNFIFVGFQFDSMAQLLHYPPKRSSYLFNAHLYPLLDKANSSPSITSGNDVFFTTSDRTINWMLDLPGLPYLFRTNLVATPYPNEKLTSVAIAYNKIYFASTSCTVYCYECTQQDPPPGVYPDPVHPPCSDCP